MRQGCRQLYRSFWHSNFITCERVAAGPTKVAKKKSRFWQGLPPTLQNGKKALVFEARTTFRAKGLLPDQPKSQFYRSFWHSNLVSTLQNRNFTAVFDTRTSFRAKRLPPDQEKSRKKSILCHPNCERVATSFRLVGTACGFKRDKKKKERDSDRGQETEREREGEREGEREREKMWRSEDKKIRR